MKAEVHNINVRECPKCSEVIVFLNNEEHKLCPRCKDVIVVNDKYKNGGML